VKIIKVIKNRTGWKAGLKENDEIISINDNIINDPIDYKYNISERFVKLNVSRGNGSFEIKIEKETDDDLGIIGDNFKIKRCNNKCIFCFIDQNPSGLRKSLYIKDEDYRFSFLYGNYVTMTNINKNDIVRIIKQRLSPLYVSVHSVNENIRKLLGMKDNGNIIDKIKMLTDNKIELHGQIVLCPMINDNEVLKETVFELFKYYPNFRSVSIVPVGLTKHRRNLYSIKKINNQYAKKILIEIKKIQKYFKKQTGENFVYPSDEFFLKADEPLPSKEYYNNFYQIENGVGLTRKFLDDFLKQSKSFPEQLNIRKKIYLITGTLGYNILKNEIVPILKKIKNLDVHLIEVKNEFFGNTVTVSGLLTGQDIYKAVKYIKENGIIILPPECVNDDGLFLDDYTINDLNKSSSCEIKIYKNNLFKEMLNN
jgi:putative radical SAM enzyme (TIGR03279 family)